MLLKPMYRCAMTLLGDAGGRGGGGGGGGDGSGGVLGATCAGVPVLTASRPGFLGAPTSIAKSGSPVLGSVCGSGAALTSTLSSSSSSSDPSTPSHRSPGSSLTYPAAATEPPPSPPLSPPSPPSVGCGGGGGGGGGGASSPPPTSWEAVFLAPRLRPGDFASVLAATSQSCWISRLCISTAWSPYLACRPHLVPAPTAQGAPISAQHRTTQHRSQDAVRQ